MESPRTSHSQAVKHVMRYVKGTIDFGIRYKKNGDAKLVGYSDSSHATDRMDGKSTTGIVFCYGGGPIAWCSQKQNTVALSSCEVEFIAATATACQAIWLKGLLEEITEKSVEAITLRVDNKSVILLMKNPVFHGRNKHIDTKYHFIRECVE
ncbi:secreted RxLR effector protein 161-like [Bidens hawaiensis]|uniref:secreted RxLR effector protein 161-like n=1 Tax=Bidens hawaiensis TaxID=980011 RepID=UPI00404B9AC9